MRLLIANLSVTISNKFHQDQERAIKSALPCVKDRREPVSHEFHIDQDHKLHSDQYSAIRDFLKRLKPVSPFTRKLRDWRPTIRHVTAGCNRHILRCDGLLFDHILAASIFLPPRVKRDAAGQVTRCTEANFAKVLEKHLRQRALLVAGDVLYFLNSISGTDSNHEGSEIISLAKRIHARAARLEGTKAKIERLRDQILARLLSLQKELYAQGRPKHSLARDFGNNNTVFFTKKGVLGFADGIVFQGDIVALVDNRYNLAALRPFGDAWEFCWYCHVPPTRIRGEAFRRMEFDIKV